MCGEFCVGGDFLVMLSSGVASNVVSTGSKEAELVGGVGGVDSKCTATSSLRGFGGL